MKRTVKILSGLLAVLAVALAVCVLLYVIGWPVSETRLIALFTSFRRLPAALLTVFAALLSGALGVFTLYGLFAQHYERRTAASIERNALGETSVAFSALAELANQVVRRHPKVKNSKARVKAIGDMVKIEVRVTTSPANSLLELTRTLQNEIAAHILSVCGVAIGSVDVTVDQTDEPEKPSRVN